MATDRYIDPQTREEWQAAVDAAKGVLGIESARLYGLVDTPFHVDVLRCRWILETAAGMGITPSPDAIERYVSELVAK